MSQELTFKKQREMTGEGGQGEQPEARLFVFYFTEREHERERGVEGEREF